MHIIRRLAVNVLYAPTDPSVANVITQMGKALLATKLFRHLSHEFDVAVLTVFVKTWYPEQYFVVY